jgi:hypothetical protein
MESLGMTLEQFANLGEAIGGFAVIASLLIVAYQIHQNTRVGKAESARACEAAWSTLNLDVISAIPPEMAHKVNSGHAVDSLSAEEFAHVQAGLRSIWHLLASEYYLYRAGVLDPKVWKRRTEWFRSYVAIPIVGYMFERDCGSLIDREIYDEIMAVEHTGVVWFGKEKAE